MVQRHLVISLDGTASGERDDLAPPPARARRSRGKTQEAGVGGDGDSPDAPVTRQEILRLIRKFGATTVTEVDYDRHVM